MENIICITSSRELITPREQTRAGFIEAALEKNRKSQPFIDEAKTLKVLASKANTPMDLLNISGIRNGLLAASGLSDKSLKYFEDADKTEAIKQLIEKFLEPAGAYFVDELVYRYLLIKGDSLGGQMRNFVGKIAKIKLTRKILSVLNMSGITYKTFYRENNKGSWNNVEYEKDYENAEVINAITWTLKGNNRVLFFDTTIPIVKKNIDICLYRGTDETFNDNIVTKNDHAIMLGELKGGIDPAGADEHWKTGNTALERIRTSFNSKGYNVKTSFIAAAIETNMSVEIWEQLQSGTLTNAANITSDSQLTHYCNWLINL